MYDGVRVPSPQENANGFAQPGASTIHSKPEEEQEEARVMEPVLVKKAHREILDHERKRRVELKCMELQEMMEEQGYSEEEIRQKVDTFRQMLMEKEGVITREDPHARHIINHTAHCSEDQRGELRLAEGYVEGCDCYDREAASQREYRMKSKSSTSPSPPPKKKKKKKSGHRRSRFESSSPPRKEKKKKSGKKHKRDRSASGSRKKRRYRSGSPKNKQKDKNKHRKRSPVESPGRSHRRGSCCSSRSASLSSVCSLSTSPSRQTPKHRADGHRAYCTPSSRSVSPSSARGGQPSPPRQNGNRDPTRNGREDEGNELLAEKTQDRFTLSGSLRVQPKLTSVSPWPKDNKVQKVISRSPGNMSPTPGEGYSAEYAGRHRSRSISSSKRSEQQKTAAEAHRESGHSPSYTGYSSDSGHSQLSLSQKSKRMQLKKAKDLHAMQRHHRVRAVGRNKSSSTSPLKREKHGRHNSERKKSLSRSLRQRSSSCSSSRSPSRERRSKSKSPHSRQNTSREKDSEAKAHHTDTEARARRRSRSYSPIRKRRRDSPSFMEPRRITSARKRPIPYYRPSPSSHSSQSSDSAHSRSRSRTYDSGSSYSRSRTLSRSRSRSRTQSRNHSHSYYSRSSSESAGF